MAEVSTSPWGADVAVSPGDPETLFLACGDNGLFSSQDLGVTWNPVNLGYHRPTRGLAVDPQNSSTIWASAPNFLRPAFYRSEDSAGHWISTASPLYIWNLAAGAEPSSVLYAVGSSSTYGIYGIYKSIDRGDSWQPIKEGASYYARVYVAPGNSDIVYVTGYSDAGGVYRSRNAGADWTLLNQGLVISDLAIEPSDGHHLLAVTEQGLLLSVNGGNSWSPVTDLAGLAISTVAFHPRLAGVAFVATSGSATARGRLYRSENGGNNWSLLKEVGGVLEAANRIRFDPLSDDILYVTSGYYLYKVSATKIGEPPVRFAPPRYDRIMGLESSGGDHTTLHVATELGIHSLTPVSDQRCDFEIVEIGPREFAPGLVISTLQVTNHGPADYVGEVRVQNEFRGQVTSVECPGLTNRWMEGSFDSSLELTLDGTFPAGENRRIRITRLRERQSHYASLPIVSTVTPTLPVELDPGTDVLSTGPFDWKRRGDCRDDRQRGVVACPFPQPRDAYPSVSPAGNVKVSSSELSKDPFPSIGS